MHCSFNEVYPLNRCSVYSPKKEWCAVTTVTKKMVQAALDGNRSGASADTCTAVIIF